jgi:hypothetical protein
MIKKPKTRVTRKEKKADAMYKANPTWAAEDNYKPKMQKGGSTNPIDAMNKAMGRDTGSTKETLRYVKKKGSGYIAPQTPSVPKPNSGTMTPKEKRQSARDTKETMRYVKKNGSGLKMKTGGMVNPNAKVSAAKVATGKAGGISKAISKTAVKSASPKGRVGGVSKAPTKATPKAKMGGSMKGKSC